jgi:hypothetical protein
VALAIRRNGVRLHAVPRLLVLRNKIGQGFVENRLQFAAFDPRDLADFVQRRSANPVPPEWTAQFQVS